MSEISAPPLPGFREALWVWTRIGFLSFGGPAGQIAMLHRVVVDEKKWVSEGQFLHALNFCMLLPGPEAQQLATYIGWLLHRAKGGIAAGLLFILPGLCIMLGLSTVYVLWKHVPLIEGIFFGLQAAVLALVVEAVQRIARRAIKTRFLLGLSGAAFFCIYLLQIPFPLIVLAAGITGWLAGRYRSELVQQAAIPDDQDLLPSVPPSWGRSLRILAVFAVLWAGPIFFLISVFGFSHVFTRISIFFSEMAVVTFGGAYAVLAYVGQQAVEVFGWLSAEEMLHGLGLAETTPGPLILVLTFVGYVAGFREGGLGSQLMGGLTGGLLATWVTFVPCFLWILLGAPYVERARHVKAFAHALAAITAAVVGVILNLAIWFALHAIFAQIQPVHFGPLRVDLPSLASLDPVMLIMAAAALLAVLRFHVGIGWLLGVAGFAGMLTRLTG